ncbi:hypothetical protein DERF_003299 [Dermatophagoides farinae]|uniref:Uncharacterized protein n=1 Tax=Dermatophagoides farinae TaxID=6954 RepID=A0A922IH37_DERFA|nr:hypothetical protein DERF_003299 [Dermatophagoides farinae]
MKRLKRSKLNENHKEKQKHMFITGLYIVCNRPTEQANTNSDNDDDDDDNDGGHMTYIAIHYKCHSKQQVLNMNELNSF